MRAFAGVDDAIVERGNIEIGGRILPGAVEAVDGLPEEAIYL